MPPTLSGLRVVAPPMNPGVRRLLGGLLCTGIAWSLVSPASADPVDPPSVDFNRDVRPILSDKCFQCHGPDEEQRKAGLRLDIDEGAKAVLPSGHAAVVPGDPGSALVLRISPSRGSDEGRMPPVESGKELQAEEVSILSRWIAEGAPYAPHWSLVPPTRPDVPKVDEEWSLSPIDAFVRARLESDGLLEGRSSSGPSDPETLLRRVTLDLTGLPPTLQEQDAYLGSTSAMRYDETIERLFESPRHGEHLARFWLDAARYGDTHGFHLDNIRSLWPWRDWVIAAFQSNMPFDQFTVEQLAGDMLPAPTQSQRIATGFNRCNPTTGEGGLIEEEYLAKYAFDRAETTATVWMGMTLQCARCHDHKYDPISARDYFGMFAFFNSLDERGTDENALAPPPSLKVIQPHDEARLAEFDSQIEALREEMDGDLPLVDVSQRSWEKASRERLEKRWVDVTPTGAISRGGATVTIAPEGDVEFSGAHPPRDVYELVAVTDLTEIRGIRIAALRDRSSGGVGRASHKNIVLSELRIEAAPLNNPLASEPVPLARVVADHHQRGFHAQKTVDGDQSTGWAIDGAVDDPHAVYLEPERPFGFPGGTLVRVWIHQESGYENHSIARVAIALTEDASAVPAAFSPWRLAPPIAVEDARRSFSDKGRESDWVASSEWPERPDFTDEEIHDLGGERTLQYLERTITVGSDRSMRVGLGSDDALRVWLNDEVVLDRNVARGAKADQDLISLKLTAGENVLRLLVANFGGASAFYFRVAGEEVDGLPPEIARAIVAGDTGARVVRDYYRRSRSPEWAALDARTAEVTAAKAAYDAGLPVTMISKERAERRPAHVLIRGEYDQKGEVVSPSVPASLPPLDDESPRNRLGLARWLVDPSHPLTARVTVNRLWQQIFGQGLVKTTEDFGAQGEWPSHPELLDWLAVEFVESGWDVRHMLRLMVTSRTYRQSSVSSLGWNAVDPENRWLARGPRQRLDAEVIRDSALHAGGLLVEQVGGPSVKPYQPPGIWFAVGYSGSNTVRFSRDDGDALYRRSLYTFWKRTAPPPVMSIFDAPSREACVVRRSLTNTPLQALALQNDEQQVEAARGLAELTLVGLGSDRERLQSAFRRTTSRRADAEEVDVLQRLLEDQRAVFAANPAWAADLLSVGVRPVSEHVPLAELAAWTCVASVLQNLSETFWKS